MSSRSSVYHAPQGESAENLGLMRRIDELFLKYPFYGSRHLRSDGLRVGLHRVRRLMRLIGLQAIYQARRTTTRHPAPGVSLYPVQKGFLYLVAVMDWATRRVPTWRSAGSTRPGRRA